MQTRLFLKFGKSRTALWKRKRATKLAARAWRGDHDAARRLVRRRWGLLSIAKHGWASRVEAMTLGRARARKHRALAESTRPAEEPTLMRQTERVVTESEREAIHARSRALRDREQGLQRQCQTEDVQRQLAGVRRELRKLEVRLRLTSGGIVR
jgi:hypothetical protein